MRNEEEKNRNVSSSIEGREVKKDKNFNIDLWHGYFIFLYY
jgi:hypothetical protein